jgi:hypothetical protein
MKPMLLQNLPADSSSSLLNAFSFSKERLPLSKRIWNGHLVDFREEGISVSADPVFSLATGRSSAQQQGTFISSRGVNLTGIAGKHFSFGSTFVENQGRFNNYVDSFIRKYGVVPGQGMVRSFHSNAYDFAWSQAYLAYNRQHFDAILGYGKNFIGDGYRSLLLSDNAFNYPYLRLQARFGHFQYTVLYNQYLNTNYIIDGSYQKKWSTIHYLQLGLGKRWQLGLFESVIWRAKDSTIKRGFEWNYLNPVLFIRPEEFALGSPDNIQMGFTARYKLGKSSYLYNQVFLDDLNIHESLANHEQHLNNKYAIQLGWWQSNVFTVPGLNYRLEYNTARPFTYGHRIVQQNYTHYNQSLADPLGANFHELINQLEYSKDRWYASFHSLLAWIGEDDKGTLSGSNLWGGEAGAPMLGDYTLEGLKTNLYYHELSVGWYVNKAWNLSLELQGGVRKKVNTKSEQSESFFSVGLKTGLWNHYYDF